MVANASAGSMSEARRGWVNVGLAAWLIGGVYLVVRGTSQGFISDVGFSPYHLVAYAGLFALAAFMATSIGGAVRRRRPWRSPFAGGYELLPVGFGLLVAYIVLDLLWRAAFGAGFGIEGALAPSRLLLVVGLALVAIGPARAALGRSTSATAPSRLAGVVAIGPGPPSRWQRASGRVSRREAGCATIGR